MSRTTQRVLAALPYVLPVLGGMSGVVYVNLHPQSYLNPALCIGLGALFGWFGARVVLHLFGRWS